MWGQNKNRFIFFTKTRFSTNWVHLKIKQPHYKLNQAITWSLSKHKLLSTPGFRVNKRPTNSENQGCSKVSDGTQNKVFFKGALPLNGGRTSFSKLCNL